MVTQLSVVSTHTVVGQSMLLNLQAGYNNSEHVESYPNVMVNYKNLSAILLLG